MRVSDRSWSLSMLGLARLVMVGSGWGYETGNNLHETNIFSIDPSTEDVTIVFSKKVKILINCKKKSIFFF